MNKAEKIKTEIDRLQSSTLDENINFKSQYDQGIFDGLSLIDNFIDSLEEEPVSEDLEYASEKYACRFSSSKYGHDKVKDAFITGAQWQKQQDQSTIELAEDHAYLAGQEQTIDKACEWLKSYRQDTHDGTGYIAGIVDDETIEEFKKAMEE